MTTWKQGVTKKAEKVEKSKDVAEIIEEFAYIIKSKNRDIVWLAYHQGKVFERFLKNAKFTRFGIPELRNRVMQNDVTLRVTKSNIFIEILLSSY